VYLRQIWTIAAKDLRSEIRTKEALNASVAFSMVILILFSFAFDQAEDLKGLLGGLLWLAYAFAGALVLNRSFARELQNDCLDALISSPAPPSALFLGKALANFALLTVVELLSLGVFAVLYDVRLSGKMGLLLLVMLLATWGMTVIGTTFSALTVNLTMRELMLPVLIYPFLIPVLMSAMILTTDLLMGVPIATNLIWLRVLVAFDIVFTAITVVFIDVVLVG
jgi:heme exporter protein B